MKQIVVKRILTDEQLNLLEGNFINESYIKHPVLNNDSIVKDENGKLIAVFKKKAVPQHIVDKARPSFRKAAKVSNNRGTASGNVSDIYKVGDKIGSRTIGKISKNRWYPLLPNGKLSKTSYGLSVASSTIGFNDRYPRIPYCRTTAFSQRNIPDYNNTLPYISYVNEIYKTYAQESYKKQKKLADLTSKDFVIKDTAFTTVTVNRNYRTACHYDAGDYINGFGNLGVLKQGTYTGGYTVIPKYGIAVDLHDTDIALFDVHELHGNTEIKRKGYSERISIVCYYRQNMIYCGNHKYELERAKKGLKTKFTQEEKQKVEKLLTDNDL